MLSTGRRRRLDWAALIRSIEIALFDSDLRVHYGRSRRAHCLKHQRSMHEMYAELMAAFAFGCVIDDAHDAWLWVGHTVGRWRSLKVLWLQRGHRG